MADSVAYENTMSTSIDERSFVKKDWLYCSDNNSNGNYGSGQFQISTEAFAGSGKHMDYTQAYLSIPLIVTLSSATDGVTDYTAVASEFMVGLKNGSHNLIHSLNVDYNNTNIIQHCQFTNIYASYKMHSTFSADDLHLLGPTLGYSLDSANSWQYNAVHTSGGNGSCNNNNLCPVFNPALGWATNQQQAGNEGFLNRQLMYNIPQNSPAIISLTADTNMTNSYQPRVVNATTYCAIYITATIRLKDISDFFDKIPITRNVNLKFTVNCNQPYFQVLKVGTAQHASSTTVGTAASPSISFLPSTLSLANGGSNPLMMASSVGSTDAVGSTGIKMPAGTYNVSLSIVSVKNPLQASLGVANHTNTVRLYVPGYTFNPDKLSEYLTMGQKKFKYTDIQQYTITNLTSGNSFNQQISNGIANLKKVILVPFISASVNGAVPAIADTTHIAVSSFSPIVSPFASEPATTSPFPGVVLTQLNLRLGSVNVLAENTNYGYEMFQNNLLGLNSINGGLTTGLSSGLINAKMWNQNYQYYVFDCSRRLPEEDYVSKALSIIGYNNSKLAIDLYCFIEIERECTIDLLTGARVE